MKGEGWIGEGRNWEKIRIRGRGGGLKSDSTERL